jgi:hypothetical protein
MEKFHLAACLLNLVTSSPSFQSRDSCKLCSCHRVWNLGQATGLMHARVCGRTFIVKWLMVIETG